MKKAKIMLAAIVVLSVVGGALAFTAKKVLTILYTVKVGTTCSTSEYFATFPEGLGTQISASTTNGGTCVAFFIGDEN